MTEESENYAKEIFAQDFFYFLLNGRSIYELFDYAQENAELHELRLEFDLEG